MTSPLKNLDLNLLKVFDAVMSEQNITRAAASLHVSQPAISNALARLRELYQDELFIRGAKGVTPTPKAQEMSVAVRRALRSIEDTLDSGDGFKPETTHRKFTVALTDYGEFYFLPHIMQRMREIAPGIDVVCLPHPGATLGSEMRTGAVDLVWDWKKIDDSEYFAEKIFEDRSYCITRKDHPEIGDDLTLERFVELEHVVLRPTRTHIPLIERQLEVLGLERKVMAEVSHVLVLPSLVANTDMVACVPERLAKLFADQLDLCIYANPVFEEPINVYQMWHRHFEQDPGHQWFRCVLKDLANRL